MTKPREWRMRDGVISWSYGAIDVIEKSAYTALFEQVEKLAKSLEHLADKNYSVEDDSNGYIPHLVCLELYSDKKLHNWAKGELAAWAEFKSSLEEGG